METKTLAYTGAAFLYQASNNFFTPEDFTEEHRLIAKTAKRFLEKEVRPKNEEIEKQNFKVVQTLFEKAGELGLLGHSVPENYGGLGLDKISKGLVGESLGSAGSYGVAHSNHTCIATLPITYFGTSQQKETYLPKLASGEFIGAYCLTEPGAGSDALSGKTTAKLNEEQTHYILNGTKMFITNAEFADTFIVYAKVDGRAFTAFIVEKDHPGLSLGPEEQKMGIKGSSTRAVIFEDCKVPVENLLGDIGKGHVIALNVLNLGRYNLGSACMGAAKYALELTLNYTSERRQFGKAIADFSATQEKIAHMALRIYASESLQYRTAGYLESALGDLYASENHYDIAKQLMEYAVECAVCKVHGSETLDFVVDEAFQLHGGYGFIKEYKIEQLYRDSRINRIFEGTNEVNRLLIIGNLLKQTAKGKIPLQQLTASAVEELKAPKSIDDHVLSTELEAIHAIRRVFLFCIGICYETYNGELMEEQEILMGLADIGIALYSLESAVIRTAKALEPETKEQHIQKTLMAQAMTGDILLEVEMIARKILQAASAENQLAHNTAVVSSELSRLQKSGLGKVKRQIAKNLLESNQYIF
ncbi:acyl-CoA dehydrogenase [Planococcus donghaensis]|uniref:Acyl-CoA dehydrogenase n=1 Tax=Planococcus donghaensis TaxID=414778 RepID=A0A1C7ELD2_9BACL|nr:acyl-CoA dehydrogenase [Planococcus donghaensis]